MNVFTLTNSLMNAKFVVNVLYIQVVCNNMSRLTVEKKHLNAKFVANVLYNQVVYRGLTVDQNRIDAHFASYL